MIFLLLKTIFLIIITKHIWSFTQLKLFFYFLKTDLNFFSKPKDYVLLNKNISEFSLQKPHFFYTYKNKSDLFL